MQQHATITEVTLMENAVSRSAANPRGRPVQNMLASFSAAYFVGALATDIVYWQMPDVMWERFSIWLITAGLVMAGLATLAFVIDLVGGKPSAPAWPAAAGYAAAVVLAVVNAFVHSRDAYTAVVPTGLALSALVAVVLLLTSWAGAALANRSRMGG